MLIGNGLYSMCYQYGVISNILKQPVTDWVLISNGHY
jgi:hypothetical protein